MSAKWGKDWRKLYRHPSSEWLALPLSVRGLGDELLRYTEDDGRIFVGTEDPVAALARRMGAHPSERKWFANALERLTQDGFCALVDGYLTIRNFVIAQSAVTPSAERMRRHRAAEDPATDPTPTPQPHGHRRSIDSEQSVARPRKDNGAGVTVASPIEETRREERREGGGAETATTARAVASGTPPPADGADDARLWLIHATANAVGPPIVDYCAWWNALADASDELVTRADRLNYEQEKNLRTIATAAKLSPKSMARIGQFVAEHRAACMRDDCLALTARDLLGFDGSRFEKIVQLAKHAHRQAKAAS